MKIKHLFYTIAIASACCFSACTRDITFLKPDHAGIRTGIDFEMQEGCKTKTKPGIHGTLDWDL